MFWIYTLLPYFYSINSENIHEVKEKLQTIPGFGMFYSPLCSHCQRIHPFWLEVSKHYLTDDKIVMFDCDCAKNSSLCAQIERVPAYPTFVKFVRNQKIHFEIIRTAEGMQEAIEGLKNVDFSIPCNAYPYLFDTYPAIVVTSPENPKQICEFITNVTQGLSPYYQRKIYYEIGPTKSVSGKINQHQTLPFTSEINVQNVRSFLEDVALIQFGNWPLSNLLRSSRNGAFLIRDGDWMSDNFRRFEYDYPSQYLFGSITFSKFKEIFPRVEITRKNLPLFAILTKNKSRFVLIRNARVESVRPFLSNKNNWETDSKIKTLPFNPLESENVDQTFLSLNDILFFPPTPQPTPVLLENINQEEYNKLNRDPHDSDKLQVDAVEEAKKDESFDEEGDLNAEDKNFAVIVISIVIFLVGFISVTTFLWENAKKSPEEKV